MRGLVAIFGDVWDNPNNALHVNNPDGTLVGAVQVVTSTVTTSAVTAATSSTTLIAANSNRVGLTIYNNSTAICYVKYGNGASLVDFSFALGPIDSAGIGDLWEPPLMFVWTGPVTAIWSAVNGHAQISEFT